MLTETQTVDLSKLIGENYVATEAALPVVTAALSSAAVIQIEAELVLLVAEYVRIENKHMRLKGGKEGIDLDFDRNRLSLMKRARVLLGMSPISANEASSNAIQSFNLCGAKWS